jgi:hypothetical protein
MHFLPLLWALSTGQLTPLLNAFWVEQDLLQKPFADAALKNLQPTFL